MFRFTNVLGVLYIYNSSSNLQSHHFPPPSILTDFREISFYCSVRLPCARSVQRPTIARRIVPCYDHVKTVGRPIMSLETVHYLRKNNAQRAIEQILVPSIVNATKHCGDACKPCVLLATKKTLFRLSTF